MRTTVPVSAGLLRDPERYFQALTAYRAGDVDDIVTQVAHAAMAATANGRELAATITSIRERWRSMIRARSDSTAWRLADTLFAQPVVNADYVARTLGVSDRGARNAIETLEAAGVLTIATSNQRHRAWQASDVLHAMDAFIVGVIMFGLVRSRIAKALWLAWPVWVAFAVIATGNHYWLDVVAGVAIAMRAGLALRQVRTLRVRRA
jgi:hypothetical protein